MGESASQRVSKSASQRALARTLASWRGDWRFPTLATNTKTSRGWGTPGRLGIQRFGLLRKSSVHRRWCGFHNPGARGGCICENECLTV